MLESRTVRTLASLFVSMIVGALALMWMETAPIDVPRTPLAAVGAEDGWYERMILRTEVGLQPVKWRNIVVRSAGDADGDIAHACHFVVADGGQVLTNDLWKRQADGYHTFAPGHDWNADSIGVCFVGGSNRASVRAERFDDLIGLVRLLQQRFKVPPERVYLHSDLDERTAPPGDEFVEAFSGRLLHETSGS